MTIGLIGAGLIARALPRLAARIVIAMPLAAGLWLTATSILEILRF